MHDSWEPSNLYAVLYLISQNFRKVDSFSILLMHLSKVSCRVLRNPPSGRDGLGFSFAFATDAAI